VDLRSRRPRAPAADRAALAVFHRRRGPLSSEGYLITEKIAGAMDLRAYVDHLATLPEAKRGPPLRTRIDQVARLVRTLHERQLSIAISKRPTF